MNETPLPDPEAPTPAELLLAEPLISAQEIGLLF